MIKIQILSVCFLIAASCRKSADEDAPVEMPGDFADAYLTSYRNWTQVLKSGDAFASLGHGGQTVRVFFHEGAIPFVRGDQPLPFAPGSLVVKAVYSEGKLETPVKLYFMLKKKAGFDASGNDWSYAFALPGAESGGVMKYDSSQGSLPVCKNCHAREAEWDYVRSAKYFRAQKVE